MGPRGSRSPPSVSPETLTVGDLNTLHHRSHPGEDSGRVEDEEDSSRSRAVGGPSLPKDTWEDHGVAPVGPHKFHRDVDRVKYWVGSSGPGYRDSK